MKNLTKYLQLLVLTMIAIPVGAFIGLAIVIFWFGLGIVTELRNDNPFVFVPFLAPAGLLIVFLYRHFGGKSAKGMTQVFQTAFGEEEKIPLRQAPFVMFTTWLTHLFGGSAGREGVAIQIGATLADFFGRILPFKDVQQVKKTFVIIGMAAGFAALFRTPFAAVFLAVEVLYSGEIQYKAILPALAASLSANFVTGLLQFTKASFPVVFEYSFDYSFDIGLVLRLLALGLCFGVCGGSFAWLLKTAKAKFSKCISNPYLRIFVAGAVLSVVLLFFHKGRYCGLGTNLISASFTGQQIYVYDWIAKLLLTVVTLSIGFQGGEVTPLFSIGSSLGIVLAGITGLPPELCAALGYVAVFGGASNTLLAPIMMGAELFGFGNLPLFMIVCIISFLFNGKQSIYTAQKQIHSI